MNSKKMDILTTTINSVNKNLEYLQESFIESHHKKGTRANYREEDIQNKIQLACLKIKSLLLPRNMARPNITDYRF